jgi:transposase
MNHTSSNWKEARRLQAWHLKQQGWSQRQIAGAFGVSEAAVSQWIRRGREGGIPALRHRPSPGAPRRLSAEQFARLPELLRRGPEAYGFRGQVWTRTRIAAVIRLECGVSYHPRHVGRLCQTIRWSPQKPARRARQRDEAAITHWREDTWPAIKRGRRPGGNVSSS